MSERDPEAREKILARRRRFVAMALATVAVGACDDKASETEPRVCLDLPIEPAHTSTSPPLVSASPTASASATPQASAVPSSSATVQPTVQPPRVMPRVCLKRAPPSDPGF